MKHDYSELVVTISGPLDAEAITQVINQAYRPDTNAAGWTHESDLVSGNRICVAQVEQIISRPESVILVGFNNADIVACVHVEKNGGNSHIGMLAVSPTLQGSGVGKRMLVYAEQYAVEHFSAEKFILTVLSSRTELIAFYLRRGYQHTGQMQDYPVHAGIGKPKFSNLTTETLEKQAHRNKT